mgnify:CR=1 FL=1
MLLFLLAVNPSHDATDNDREDDSYSTSGEEVEMDESESGDVSSDEGVEDSVQSSQKIQVDSAHVKEVKEIVNKNPRITLWSARSSAVFRYLRKTEPEFSISKEASTLID